MKHDFSMLDKVQQLCWKTSGSHLQLRNPAKGNAAKEVTFSLGDTDEDDFLNVINVSALPEDQRDISAT